MSIETSRTISNLSLLLKILTQVLEFPKRLALFLTLISELAIGLFKLLLKKLIAMRANVLRLLGTNSKSSLFERVKEVKRSQSVENFCYMLQF